ncbi:MAG: heme ABC exporter ATP-binding protein CcmA, partial [Actinomycetota bacterium]
ITVAPDDEADRSVASRSASSSGATVIVASHELERAGALATRVVEVVAGQVQAVDDPVDDGSGGTEQAR